MVKKAI